MFKNVAGIDDRLSFLKRIPPDIYAYVGFIVVFFVAYADVFLQQAPFWALNLPFFPTLNSAYYTSGQLYWFHGNLGSPAQPNLAYWLPYVSILISFGNTALAQKLLILSPLFSCFTMYFFLTKHFPGSRLANFSGAIIYGLGPATVLDFSDFLLWGLALIPIIFHSLLNILKGERQLRDILLLGLSLSIFTSFLPQILSLILFLCLIFFSLNFLFVKNKINYFKKTLVSLSLSILFFIVSCPYLLTGTQHLMISIGWVPPSSIITSPALPATSSNPSLYFATYANQEIINTIRLIGGSPGNFLSETNMFGFVLPIFAFLSILLVTKGKKFLNLLALSLISIFTIVIIYGIHLRISWVMWLLYNTPISLFYYPERPLYVVTFAFSVMISVTLDRLFNIIKNSHFNIRKYSWLPISFDWKKLISLLMAILLLFSVFNFAPIFSQTSHQERDIQLPSYYFDIQTWLNAHPGDYRVMFLPTGSFSSILDTPDVFEYTSGYVSYATKNYVDFVNNQLVRFETSNLGALLAPASVKYIIVATPNLNALWKGTPALGAPLTTADLSGPVRYTDGKVQGDPINIKKILDAQRDLKSVYNNGNFSVYENLDYFSKISVFSSATYVIGSQDVMSILPYIPGFNVKSTMIIFANENNGLSKTLSAASSSIIFFNTDTRNYLGNSLTPNLLNESENLLDDISLKNQVYLFTQNSSSFFSQSVMLTKGEYWISVNPLGLGSCNPILKVDGINTEYASSMSDGWHVFPPIYLQSGTHNITLANVACGDIIAVHNRPDLEDIFNDGVSINNTVSKLSDTSYKININVIQPFFMALSESYDNNWVAYCQSGQLIHFMAFSYSNAYYFNTTDCDHDITIRYDAPLLNQLYMTQQILFIIISAVVVILYILYLISNRLKFKKKIN